MLTFSSFEIIFAHVQLSGIISSFLESKNAWQNRCDFLKGRPPQNLSASHIGDRRTPGSKRPVERPRKNGATVQLLLCSCLFLAWLEPLEPLGSVQKATSSPTVRPWQAEPAAFSGVAKLRRAEPRFSAANPRRGVPPDHIEVEKWYVSWCLFLQRVVGCLQL